jgi:SAM-dependent methyltransferase
MSVQNGAIPITIFEQPGPTLASWTAVDRCPVCGSRVTAASALLPDRHYAFGDEQVPFPDTGIAVTGCAVCGAYYKSLVPSQRFLAEMFGHHAEKKWGKSHDFLRELDTVKRLWGAQTLDLLDVGAADGGMLEAHTAAGMTGRRSALDVIRYSGVERHLTGEFIEGFLDDPKLAWSREPYDVVTLFDVVEHLYRPQDAFENLHSLVRPGGLVYLETGNVENFWSRRFGINHWWYVRLLEHHVFWSRRSIDHIAAVHGFKVVSWKEGRHKSSRGRSPVRVIGCCLKTALYCAVGRNYASIAQAFGKQGSQPWFPFARDHFQACLMRA